MIHYKRQIEDTSKDKTHASLNKAITMSSLARTRLRAPMDRATKVLNPTTSTSTHPWATLCLPDPSATDTLQTIPSLDHWLLSIERRAWDQRRSIRIVPITVAPLTSSVQTKKRMKTTRQWTPWSRTPCPRWSSMASRTSRTSMKSFSGAKTCKSRILTLVISVNKVSFHWTLQSTRKPSTSRTTLRTKKDTKLNYNLSGSSMKYQRLTRCTSDKKIYKMKTVTSLCKGCHQETQECFRVVHSSSTTMASSVPSQAVGAQAMSIASFPTKSKWRPKIKFTHASKGCPEAVAWKYSITFQGKNRCRISCKELSEAQSLETTVRITLGNTLRQLTSYKSRTRDRALYQTRVRTMVDQSILTRFSAAKKQEPTWWSRTFHADIRITRLNRTLRKIIRIISMISDYQWIKGKTLRGTTSRVWRPTRLIVLLTLDTSSLSTTSFTISKTTTGPSMLQTRRLTFILRTNSHCSFTTKCVPSIWLNKTEMTFKRFWTRTVSPSLLKTFRQFKV